jgi:hypothetical protein
MNWQNVADDGRCWVLRDGHEPFAVLPCNVCFVPVDICEARDGAARVSCPICRKRVDAASLYPGDGGVERDGGWLAYSPNPYTIPGLLGVMLGMHHVGLAVEVSPLPGF